MAPKGAKTMDFLKNFFDEHIISHGLWPSRSSDMTPSNYFVWEYIKNGVFQHYLISLAHSKTLITEAVESVTPVMLLKVFQNLEKWVKACEDVQEVILNICYKIY